MSKKSYSPVSIATVPFLFVMVLSVVVSVFFWGCSSGGGDDTCSASMNLPGFERQVYENQEKTETAMN